MHLTCSQKTCSRSSWENFIPEWRLPREQCFFVRPLFCTKGSANDLCSGYEYAAFRSGNFVRHDFVPASHVLFAFLSFMFCCWFSLVCLFSVSLPWIQNRNQVIHGMRRTRTQEHAGPVICLWSERISGVCERRRWSTARRCQVQCGRTILHWACCRGGRSKDKYVLFLSLSVLLFLPIIRSVYFPRPSISVRATP